MGVLLRFGPVTAPANPHSETDSRGRQSCVTGKISASRNQLWGRGRRLHSDHYRGENQSYSVMKNTPPPSLTRFY